MFKNLPKTLWVYAIWTVFIVVAIWLLSGCGSSDYLLDDGTYKVSGTMTVTTDPLSNSFESEWFIQHRNEGRYRLIMNSTTELWGADSNGRAVFVLNDQINDSSDCPFWATLGVELTPTANGFEGYVFSAYTWCSYYNPSTNEIALQDNNTEYFVVGNLQ